MSNFQRPIILAITAQIYILLIITGLTNSTWVPDNFEVSVSANSEPCLQVSNPGTYTVIQELPDYIRTSLFKLTTTEPNLLALGHELCITEGQLIKSAGSVGNSYFSNEYQFRNPVTDSQVILVYIRTDLPKYGALWFRFVTANTTIDNIQLNLEDYLMPFTYGIIPLLTPANLIYMSFGIVPSKNNMDMRMEFLNILPVSHLSFRSIAIVNSSIPYQKLFVINDDDMLTGYVFTADETTLTLAFPIRVFTDKIVLTWETIPTQLEITYNNSQSPSPLLKVNRPKYKTIIGPKKLAGLNITSLEIKFKGPAKLNNIYGN